MKGYSPRGDWSEDVILGSTRDLIRFSQSFKLPYNKKACWEWISRSSLDKNGYPRFSINTIDDNGNLKNLTMRAARVAYTIHNKEAPPPANTGLGVLHTCDNPLCVNPHHLYIGDKKQNAKDRAERTGYATMQRGEMHISSKLTEQNVRDIVTLANQFKNSGQIKKELNLDVTVHCICKILDGSLWTHLNLDRKSITQLRADKYQKIKEMSSIGLSNEEIAKNMNMNKRTIHEIIRRK